MRLPSISQGVKPIIPVFAFDKLFESELLNKLSPAHRASVNYNSWLQMTYLWLNLIQLLLVWEVKQIANAINVLIMQLFHSIRINAQFRNKRSEGKTEVDDGNLRIYV